jgi:EpsI family protein
MTASVRLLVVTIFVIATTAYLGVASRAEVLPPRTPLAQLPLAVGDWRGREMPRFSEQIESVLGVDDYITRSYAAPGHAALGLYVGYHTSQRQGDTIHSPLNCLPGAGWQPVEQGRAVFTVMGAPVTPGVPTQVEVNRVVIQKGLDRQLVLYWYQSYRRVVASEYWGKVYTVLDAARYNRTDAALVRLVLPLRADVPVVTVERDGIAFAKTLFPLLGRHLSS